MEEVRQRGVFLRGLGLSTIAFDSGSQSVTEVQTELQNCGTDQDLILL